MQRSSPSCSTLTKYRRFMCLAVVAGHGVTPSDQVDQVWHLHLTYTRTYWERFCPDALGTPVHHGPTRGGPQEAATYRDWYVRTLESYRRVFGEDPPVDIWPPVSVRFGEDLRFERVNTTRHWIIRKPGGPTTRRLGIAAVGVIGVGLAGLLSAAVTPVARFTGQFDLVGDTSPLGLLIGAGVTIAVLVSITRHYRCDQCGRYWKFRPNGFTGQGGRLSREQWECESCGHTSWRDRGRDGGGCGAGGCSGCGGCGGD